MSQASGAVGVDARGSVTGVALAGRAWRRGARAAIVHTRGGVRKGEREDVKRERVGGHRSRQVPRGRAVHRVLWAGGGPADRRG